MFNIPWDTVKDYSGDVLTGHSLRLVLKKINLTTKPDML